MQKQAKNGHGVQYPLNKDFKTRKSGSFILKLGVNRPYDILSTKISKSGICFQKLQKSYQNLKLKNQYHIYL